MIKKNIILIIVAIIIIGVAGWFIYKDFLATKNKSMSEVGLPSLEKSTSTSTTKTVFVAKDIPDLDKKIIVKENLSLEQRQKLLSDIHDTRKRLKEDHDILQDWLQLGLLYKALEDYEGAKEAWEFAALIRPNSGVAFHNLGDLYHFYLPNYSLSEKNYLKSIENSPNMIITYQKLHELYIYSYKEKEYLADDILKQGLKANPGNEYLQSLLEQYKNK